MTNLPYFRRLASALPCAVALALCFAISGCARRLSVQHVATSVEPPANVAVYLSVRNGEEGVSDLEVEDFRIYEDGRLIDAQSSGLRLLDRDIGVVRHTLLLVDLSDASDSEKVEAITRAVSISARRIAKTQPVSVFGFAGSELFELGQYSPSAPEPEKELSLADFTAKGGAPRDVYGAVLAGLERLDSMKPADSEAVLVGTLVVFLSGPDTAKKVDPVRMDLAFARFKHRVLAVGVGKWKADPSVHDVGRDGAYPAPEYAKLLDAFTELSQTVESDYAGSYFLSYCSPSRSGYRTLRVEVNTTVEERAVRGTVETEFDASGFAAGCGPDADAASEGASTPRPATPKKRRSSAPSADTASASTAEQPEEPPPQPARTEDGFVP